MNLKYGVPWRAQPISTGWGLNIEFEHSLGGKSRWRVFAPVGVAGLARETRFWATGSPPVIPSRAYIQRSWGL